MAEIKWIKLSVDMFEDEKIDFIQGLPEGDALINIWVRLITMAGKCNQSGYILITENIPYTPDALAHRMKKSPTIMNLALNTFQKLGMLQISESGMSLTNWSKYQDTESMERLKELNRNRQQRHRDKLKNKDNSELLPESTEESTKEDIYIYKDIRAKNVINNVTDNIIILTNEEAEFISILETIPGFPLDREKDRLYYHTLEERYPTLNILEALKDWKIYKEDKPLKPKDNARSQINTSLKKYVGWGRNLKIKEVDKSKASNFNEFDYSDTKIKR